MKISLTKNIVYNANSMGIIERQQLQLKNKYLLDMNSFVNRLGLQDTEERRYKITNILELDEKWLPVVTFSATKSTIFKMEQSTLQRSQ